MFAVRTGVDFLKCLFFHFFCCGLFAARTAPSGTIIYFLPVLSTNRVKGLAGILEERDSFHTERACDEAEI